jgi:N6-L-threonylcarbamoyladenine synthase
MKILSIESSCDETAVAIVEDGQKVHANVISSQIVKHAKTGGVVPEVAARQHVLMMKPVLRRAFEESGLSWDDIDAVAVASEPGLVGCVMIGRMTAQALAWSKGKPLIEVNHVHGHILSNWLDLEQEPQFPVLVLTVSGGHNDLVLVRDYGDFEILGQTQDDAAGEAFDKIARMLGLGYPGGPILEKRAAEGNPEFVDFPRASMRGYDFSFSGLKTAILYYLQEHEEQMEDEQFINDVAASAQEALVDALVAKLIKAVKQYAPREVHLAGGCSANKHLRRKIEARLAKGKRPPVFRHPAKMSYCTDNAAMIGTVAYFMGKATS